MKVTLKKVKVNSFLQASGDPKIKNSKYYPGGKTSFPAPLDAKNGLYPKTGLTTDDEKRLEKALRLPEGTLAITSDYWKTFAVVVTEDGLDLDTSIPFEELQYKILCQWEIDIAKSLSELKDKPDAQFVMTNIDQESADKNSKRENKKKAFAYLDKMSPEDYVEYLVAKGEPGVSSLSNERIRDLVESDAEGNPKTFLEFVKDPHYKDKLFVARLVNAGILRMQGTRYFETASGQTLGATLLQTIDYLNAPKNQNVYITLSRQLEGEAVGKVSTEDLDE